MEIITQYMGHTMLLMGLVINLNGCRLMFPDRITHLYLSTRYLTYITSVHIKKCNTLVSQVTLDEEKIMAVLRELSLSP